MHFVIIILLLCDRRCFSIGDARGVISNEVSNVFIYIGLSNIIFIPPSIYIVLRYDEDGWDACYPEQMSWVRILKRL